jgi:hypothetical protein
MHAILPSERGFMVKPQGLLRSKAKDSPSDVGDEDDDTDDDLAEDMADVSIDSEVEFLEAVDLSAELMVVADRNAGNGGVVASPPATQEEFNAGDFSVDSNGDLVPPRKQGVFMS